MRYLGIRLLCLACLAGCGKTADDRTTEPARTERDTRRRSNFSKELTTDRARELVPRAASLSREEFRELLEHPPVWISEVENQSLTAVLLGLDPFAATLQNPGAVGGFRYLMPELLLDSERIREAVQGAEGDFVSIIRPEYITNCTCLTQGTSARGRVEYRAGRLYEGSTDFLAERRGDEWQIVAFHVPEYRLTTRRQADGSWRLESADELLGVAGP